MIRVGVIVDEGRIAGTTADFISASAGNPYFEITHLFVQMAGDQGAGRVARVRSYLRRRGIARLLRQVTWTLLSRIDGLALHFVPRLRGATQNGRGGDRDLKRVHLRPKRSRSGVIHRFAADDIDRIRRSGCDLLIRGGSGVLRGDILTACRFGVISLHHGSSDCYRGSPAGFWEVYDRAPTTGFIVQQLTEELDGGNVLMAGSLPTRRVWSLNREQVFRKANSFLVAVLEHVGRTGRMPAAMEKRPYSFPLRTVPAVTVQASYLLRSLLPAVATKLMDRLPLRRVTRWGVAFQFVSDWRSAVLHRATVIPNPPGRFLADPFVWEADGQTVCFVEDYDYRNRRGRISAFAVDPGRSRFLGKVLDEPFHLSYPFVFAHEGELYMCPETSALNEIRVYRCTRFPLDWEYAATLMTGVSAVDTNIFEYGGRWWLMTNKDSSGIGEHCSELHLYSADSPLSDDWMPHPASPILVNARKARNGGFICEGTGLWRVCQVQGFDSYGESAGIARIEELTPDTYRERPYCAVEPAFFRHLVGTHTFTFRNGAVAFDFARRAWVWSGRRTLKRPTWHSK